VVHFLGANGAAKLVAAVIAAMVALTIGAGPSFTVTTTELAGADCGVDSAGAPAPIGVWKAAAAPGAGEAISAVAAAAGGAKASSASRFSVNTKTMGVGARAA